MTEGADGSTATLTFTVTLSTASGQEVTVAYADRDTGTATSGTDYQALTAGTLTFAAGETSKTVAVTVTGDNLDEGNETVVLRLSSASNATLSGGSTTLDATGTITDDDDAPSGVTLTVDADTATQGVQSSVAEDGGAKTVRVTATVDGTTRFAAAKTVTVVVGAAGDSAVEGTDYGSVEDLTLTIAAGAQSASGTFTLTPVDDALDEDDETISLDGSASGVTVTDASVAIIDDDATPTVSVADAGAVTEGNDPATTANMSFTVTLSAASGRDVTVPYTLGGTATAGSDYEEPQTRSVTISAGDTSAAIVIKVKGDTADEDNETVEVTLGTLTNATLSSDQGAGTASGTITDDDATPTATLTLTPTSVKESSSTASETVSTVTASLSAATWEDVTVTVSVANGSPVTVSTNKVLTIAKGRTASTGTVTLTAVDNAVDAADASVTVSGTASGASVANPQAVTLTITDDDGRGITVSETKLTLAEADNAGTSGTEEHKATYTVALDTQPTGTVTVTVASGDEKVARVSPATLTFTAQSYAAQTVTVTAVADALDNANGKRTTTITHTVSAPGTDYASVSAASVDIEVTDDDVASTGAITLVANPDTLAESASATTVTVTATLPGSVARDTDTVIAVTVGDSADAATEGTDYGTVEDFTLTVAAGSLTGTKTFSLDPTQDTLDEGTGETLTVTGTTAVSGLTVGSDEITLTDDDDAPELSVDAPSVTEGADGSTATLTFTVTLNAASGREVTVAYADRGSGTATSGTDYTAITSGTLTFAAGETSKTVAVTVTGDNLDEGNETVVLRLSSASNATLSGGNATLDATGTITDDDGRGITVSETKLTLAEADNAGTQSTEENKATYTVGLDTQPTGTVTVTVASGATGVATVSPATLTFTAQSYAAQTVTVTAVADALANANDKRTTTITHTVSAPGTDYASESAASVDIEVTDDDVASTGAVTLVANPDTLAESASATTVTVTATVPGSVARDTDTVIAVVVGAGTDAATEGTDYGTVDGFTLTVDAGSLTGTKTFTLTPTQDTLDEGTGETLSVTGTTAVSGLTVGSDEITITDDDAAPVLSVDAPSVTEGADGSTATLTFTVTLSTASGQEVTVAYADRGTGTAVSGTDYQEISSGTLTFAAGETSKTVAVTVTGDNLDEGNETVVLRLSSASNATLSGGGTTLDATGTITDDDGRGVSVSVDKLTLAEADNAGTQGTEENKATYTVALDSQPTGTVTVTVASGATGVATVSPGTLTFTAQSYAAQTVTVTAVADTLDNAGDKRTTTITHTVSAPGTDYAAVTAASVTVEVTDDETAPTGEIDLAANPDTLAESASATTITVTATLPGSVARDTATAITVKVGDSADAATEGTDYGQVDDFTLTVAAGALTGTETFTLDADPGHPDEGTGETLSVTGTTTVTGLTVGSDEITRRSPSRAPPPSPVAVGGERAGGDGGLCRPRHRHGDLRDGLPVAHGGHAHLRRRRDEQDGRGDGHRRQSGRGQRDGGAAAVLGLGCDPERRQLHPRRHRHHHRRRRRALGRDADGGRRHRDRRRAVLGGGGRRCEDRAGDGDGRRHHPLRRGDDGDGRGRGLGRQRRRGYRLRQCRGPDADHRGRGAERQRHLHPDACRRRPGQADGPSAWTAAPPGSPSPMPRSPSPTTTPRRRCRWRTRRR